MARALINVPQKATRGQVIEIKTLISHIMETGFRHDNVGKPIPRNIITGFVARYNGEEIFRADLFPAIAANPFVSFHTVATESGTHRVRVDRRQRLPRDRRGEDHRGMIAGVGEIACSATSNRRRGHGRGGDCFARAAWRWWRALPTATLLLLALCNIASRHRDPARPAPLRLCGSRPRHQGDGGRRHRQPGDVLGARRRGAVERRRRAAPTSRAPTATATRRRA